MRIVTVRLSEEHQKLLEEISRILGTTRSDSIRYAIKVLHKLLTNHIDDDVNKLELVEKIAEGFKKLEISEI